MQHFRKSKLMQKSMMKKLSKFKIDTKSVLLIFPFVSNTARHGTGSDM